MFPVFNRRMRLALFVNEIAKLSGLALVLVMSNCRSHYRLPNRNIEVNVAPAGLQGSGPRGLS